MRILLVTQVPCSAGTFITRYLAELLCAQALVPETNPWASASIGRNAFSPLFPSAPLVKTGVLSQAESIQCYESSILRLLLALERKGVELLVLRDHMFSEWFADLRPASPFWPEFLNRTGYNYKVLFTARNPFDSYLGLCSSFPGVARRLTLDQYSSCYLRAINGYETACPDLLKLTIEQLAESVASGSKHSVLSELMHWSDRAPTAMIPTVDPQKWQTSGASGRKATRPQLMPRRAFTNQLRRQALSSQAFSELQQRLGYGSEAPYLSSSRVRILCILASGQEVLTRMMSRLPLLGGRLHRLRWFVAQPK
jgi:hypothetical protein